MKKCCFFFFFPLCFWANVSYINISAGGFDFFRSKYRTGEIKLEYQPAASFCWLHPLFGILQTFKGSTYLSCGIALNVIVKQMFIVPSISAGYYHKGGGKDLGLPLEFRSAVTLGLQHPRNHSRIGVQIAHMSNASFGSKNPGEESLSLVLSFPLQDKK